MNSTQTGLLTIGGMAGAQLLIGGIGIGMLGTAVGVPAAAIVGTVGGTATTAKLYDENKDSIKAWASNRPSIYWLKKDSITIRFRIYPNSFKGTYAISLSENNGFNDAIGSSVDDLRTIYKSYLKQGFKPV